MRVVPFSHFVKPLACARPRICSFNALKREAKAMGSWRGLAPPQSAAVGLQGEAALLFTCCAARPPHLTPVSTRRAFGPGLGGSWESAAAGSSPHLRSFAARRTRKRP